MTSRRFQNWLPILAVSLVLAPSVVLAQSKNIDQLSAGGALSGTELIPMFQTSNPAVTTTPAAIKTFVGTPGGPPTGSAGGVLSGTYPDPGFASSTGSGATVLATSPMLVTPILGVAAGTSVSLGSPSGSASTGDVNISGAFKVNGVAIVTGGGSVTLNNSVLIETLPNDVSTGTAAGQLVVDSGGSVITATVAQTSSAIGICVSGISGTSCGTSGNASIAIAGQASCVFDGATTAGDFVQASTTVAGDCHDAGATVPTTVAVLGQVLTTHGGAGTYAVDISPIGSMAALNSKAKPGGSNTNVQINSSGSFGVGNANLVAGALSLGASGTAGSVGMGNATSGTVTLQPVTGALGSVTASLPANTGTLAELNLPESWPAAQRGTPTNITISTATFTPNFDTAQNFEVDLTSACPCTLANPSTTLVAGQSGMIEVHQDGSGSRTIGTWGTDYQYVGGTSTITLSTAASSVDYLPYYVNNAATGIVLGSIIKAPAH